MVDLYPVDPQFAEKSRINKTTYQQQYQTSVDDPDAFWGAAARRLDWFK
jgi:acetyl-CoA synthetase